MTELRWLGEYELKTVYSLLGGAVFPWFRVWFSALRAARRPLRCGHCLTIDVTSKGSGVTCIVTMGWRADALLDSIEFRRATISESLAVADGVNRTRCSGLRFPTRLGRLEIGRVLDVERTPGGTGFAIGALLKGCRLIGP